MTAKVFVSRFSAWAPGICGLDQWREWADGRREIGECGESSESPALSWTEPLFRRRLSQISKMTIEVTKRLCPVEEGAKLVFASFRGELGCQFKVNKMLVEDGALTPAAFSLSVFNTPPALACIALSLKGGYSAVYPGGDKFVYGFLSAAAALLSEDVKSESEKSKGAKDVIFVYADELVRDEYRSCMKGAVPPPPLAFAALLSAQGQGEAIDCSYDNKDLVCRESFLKKLFGMGNVVYAP
jgi:hypothetical protein